MTRLQSTTRRGLSLAAMAGIVLVLAACGSHSDNDNNGMTQTPAPTPPPVAGTPTPPPAMIDAFIASVMQLVGSQDDTGEPVAIDSVNATMPEDNEPIVLAGP
jgi:hypothetical protein